MMKTMAPIINVMAGLLLYCASGCTHTMHAPRELVSYGQPVDQIPLKAAVAILPELANAKWEFHYMGDTWLMLLGENLSRNSENMARQVFTHVAVEKVDSDGAVSRCGRDRDSENERV